MSQSPEHQKRRVSAFTVGLLVIVIGSVVFYVLALANPPSCAEIDNYDGPCLDQGGQFLLSYVITIPAGILAGTTLAIWRKLREKAAQRR